MSRPFLPPDDQAFPKRAPMVPFDGRRTFGAPQYVAQLPKDLRHAQLAAEAECRRMARKRRVI
jgi:hypothetical protein